MSKYHKKVDWDAMLPDWSAGIKTILELSKEYDVSRAAIVKHWRELGIERDLTAKIKAKADALVTKSLVASQVAALKDVTESEIVDANALNSATIQITERKDVTKSRNIVIKLVNELEDQIDYKEDYEKLGEMFRNPDQYGNDKLNDVYMKTISFSGRVDGMKKLSDSLKTLIELERRVYKIDDEVSVDTNKRVNIKVNFIDA